MLKWSLILAIFSLSSGLGWFYWSLGYKARMHAENKRKTEEFNKADKRYNKTMANMALIEDYYKDFKYYKDANFLNRGQRRLTVENHLRSLKKLKLPRLGYGFMPPRTHRIPPVDMNKEFQLYAWDLTLKMELLHGGDLFSLLNEMDKKHKDGLFAVKSCKLQHLREPSVDLSKGNLEGTCTLEFYDQEIKESNGKDNE